MRLLKPLLYRALLVSALNIFPQAAEARWQVKSEFQLHLTEPLFDKLIQDFWASLQGSQHIAVGNQSFAANGNTNVQINGINVDVNYDFPLPKRADPAHREWLLSTSAIGAKVTADQLIVTQTQTVEQNGIFFEVTARAECRNISLTLPTGSASISANIRAEVAQNQIQLSMPNYSAQWPSGAWEVSSLECPQLANIQGVIRDRIVNFLSSFENLDHEVGTALNSKFQAWSRDASVLLLSQQKLPSNNDYMNIYYEPKTAVENNGNGLILGGTLRFEYPYVAKGQEFLQEFALPAGTTLVPKATPQLIIPFDAIRALMTGEYFANKLEYTLRSTEITAFNDLMHSPFKKAFGWTDLLSFPEDSVFLFQMLPVGPPAFDHAASSAAGTITGDLTLPLSSRMFAPFSDGKYYPYVEFRSALTGPASLTLQSDGKIDFKVAADNNPITYAYSQPYVNSRHVNEYIAVDTISTAIRGSLNANGMKLALPTFNVGKQLVLAPNGWDLLKQDVLRLDFNANPASTASVVTSAVKTANGKTLSVTSARSRK